MAAVIEELDPRKCTESVEEIARLEKKTFPKHESLARSLEQEVMRKNSGLMYAKVTSEGRGGGEIVGYVMYSWISSLCASITKLAVKESYRRQGLGEALMKAAIQKCRTRNVLRVCLHVDPERIPAVSLYEKLGFQIEDLVASYYSVDRNAYRMYLDFDG
ncbi:hypothetical protein IEQ34_022235 [Dendrobium chrysotoxum]|uniref:N-acetyltransferase domain-containing protein n=1 Tax=Dendrobium chrysotoxum TaxID=161865 RepID=A0AAV7FWX6_DENCH|nr:hypothetical protein IEQ34_022235 [Dendrobium chrysotoxum]